MSTFTPRRIIGIDVGLNGAIAMMQGETLTGIVDMPTVSLTRNGVAKRQISIPELIAILDEFKPEEAFIEKVFAMAGQGVTSVFSFGRSLGAIEGVIAARSIKATNHATDMDESYGGQRRQGWRQSKGYGALPS